MRTRGRWSITVAVLIGTFIGLAPLVGPQLRAQPVRYRAEFAPIVLSGSDERVAVNPALIEEMREDEGVVLIRLTSGERLRTRGTIAEVAAILRVSVWREDGPNGQ